MERSNPKLWERIKTKVLKGDKGGLPGQWSARKAQLAVKLYKDQGGKYKGRKSAKNALHQWTVQDWRTKTGLPSLMTGERYLPAKAIKALSPSEYRKTSRRKRSAIQKGTQFSKQPREIARKTRRYRKWI
jgi:hypothetical protein